MTYGEVAQFAIAGVPIVVAGPIPFDHRDRLKGRWNGLAASDEALKISFVQDFRGEFEPLLDRAQRGGVFSLDDNGELTIATPALQGRSHSIMQTVRPGYEYRVQFGDANGLANEEWLWVRDVFRHALPCRHQGLIAHASGFVAAPGFGVLCPGVSGAGKSTLASLIDRDHGAAVEVLSDERIAVTLDSSWLKIWGTPWESSAELSSNAHAALRAVVFPARGGAHPNLYSVPRREAARRLMRTLAFPVWSADRMAFGFDLLERILEEVPAFEYRYTPAPGAGTRLVDALKEAFSLGGVQ